MSTSVAEAQAVRAWIDDERLWVELRDGRQLATPLSFFPRLMHASKFDRERSFISDEGRGLHWPELDEDISVPGLLEGRGDETRAGREHRANCPECAPTR